MTRDDIFRIARECQKEDYSCEAGHWFKMEVKDLERFAVLIAEAERESCAMECINLAHKWTRLGAWGENNEFHECAEAIRARGQA